MLEGVSVVVLIAVVAIVAGIGFGIVIAPRIARVAERMTEDDEEPRDGPD